MYLRILGTIIFKPTQIREIKVKNVGGHRIKNSNLIWQTTGQHYLSLSQIHVCTCQTCTVTR